MREIKFRAWDKDYSTMKRDGYVKNVLCNFDGDYTRHFDLMQYTGLKDRNGVEIYEGDLVEVTQGNYKWRYKIVWNDYFCEIEAKTYWRNFYNDDDGNYVFEDTFTDEGEANLPSASKGEVIGNIYENSDLLAPKHNQASQLAEGV